MIIKCLLRIFRGRHADGPNVVLLTADSFQQTAKCSNWLRLFLCGTNVYQNWKLPHPMIMGFLNIGKNVWEKMIQVKRGLARIAMPVKQCRQDEIAGGLLIGG